MDENKNERRWLEYLGICFAVFLGAFLAFHFVFSQATKTYLPHHHLKGPDINKIMQDEDKMFRESDRMFNEMDKFSAKMFDKQEKREFKNAFSTVQTIKEDDAYKIIINLKKFNDDEKNVNFSLNDNMVTISGEVEKQKENSEKYYTFTESFVIPEKIDESKITKIRKGSKYIITLPIVDED